MTAFLFLQRFDNGVPAPMPYQPLIELLGRHGVLGRGRGDAEICFEADQVAAVCTVPGSAQTGALCVGFERPRYDAPLRRLVWECVEAFGCAVFDDALDAVYASGPLPPALAAACVDGVRRAGSAQQLWPDAFYIAFEGPPRPALLYTNPNPAGPRHQMFDASSADGKELAIEFALRPEACNPGTLRVLRNLELRVDAAQSVNPQFAVAYRFAHFESSLLLLESDQLAERRIRAAIVSPPPGERAPQASGFVADRGVAVSMRDPAQQLVENVRNKYQLELDGGRASVATLARLLDPLHAFYAQERAKHPRHQAFDNPVATSWAIKAGSYLGEMMRRQLGGQWGYVTRGQRRVPSVRLHSGCTVQPHLQVLDHIVNGAPASVAPWFAAIAGKHASATARGDDHACAILDLCGCLMGANSFLQDGMPLPALVPVQELDFSVASLVKLDLYLQEVARQSATLSERALSNVTIAAGAYLGEVVRSHASDPARWQWTNYDDFVRANPPFAQERARTAEHIVFLDSAEQTVYPLGHVAAIVTGARVSSTQAFARHLLGDPSTAAAGPAAAEPVAIGTAPADPDMANALDAVRASLSRWRAAAGPAQFSQLSANGPAWLHNDPMGEILRSQQLLLSKGLVVWGAIVMANNQLFASGPDDLPAVLVYSPEQHFDARPQELRRIARVLYAHKSNDAPEPLRRIGQLLANERERFFKLPLPPEVTERKVLASVLMAFRGHLPLGVLAGLWFPILIHPFTGSVMMVPGQFWPQDLLARWQARELDC